MRISMAVQSHQLEVACKPVSDCLDQARMHVLTHAQMDGQLKNTMPSSAQETGGGGLTKMGIFALIQRQHELEILPIAKSLQRPERPCPFCIAYR